MADVRALLAAERQSRRISHPHLTYAKSGQLLCNVCQLNVKSEALWEGHLRSANHKKNAQSAQDSGIKSLKRKIEDVDGLSVEDDFETKTEGRKKTKSRPESFVEETNLPERQSSSIVHGEQVEDHQMPPAERPESAIPAPQPAVTAAAVDEDEWAAFEREVAPLAQNQVQADYSSAIISAAPVSAAQLAEQAKEDMRRRQETDAEGEQEDEERRLEDEFDVMEEMEERVRKLKEKREALRLMGKGNGEADAAPTHVEEQEDIAVEPGGARQGEEKEKEESYEDGDEDEDEVDDWYS